MESAAPRDDGCAGASAAPAPGVGPHDAPTTGMDSLAAAAQLVSFCQTAAPNDVHHFPTIGCRKGFRELHVSEVRTLSAAVGGHIKQNYYSTVCADLRHVA